MSRLGRRRRLRQPSAGEAVASEHWTVPIGVWSGTPIQLHVSLAVVGLVAGIACCHPGAGTWRLGLAVYVVSLLVHESAHLAAASVARRQPLRLMPREPIVLGPFGGLRTAEGDTDPRDHVFVAMAGPVANLAMVVAAMCGLAAVGEPLSGDLLIRPFAALSVDSPGPTPLATLLPLLIAINWPLFLVNFAPASPFDGGVAFRSLLTVWVGFRRASTVALWVALSLAAGLIVAGGVSQVLAGAPAVVSNALVALGVVIAFGARADYLTGVEDLGFEDLSGLSLTDLPPRRARDDARSEPLLLDEEESEALRERWDAGRVDAILEKVHDHGMSELTANERAILERASEFFQRRRSGP